MKNELIETTADKLQKGDIFSFGKNSWDGSQRFHGYSFFVDRRQEWVDKYEDGARICFNYISFNYQGDIDTAGPYCFQWSHVQDPSEIKVYLKSDHLISDSLKYKGKIYYNDHNNVRVYVRYKVNAVNMQSAIPTPVHQ